MFFCLKWVKIPGLHYSILYSILWNLADYERKGGDEGWGSGNISKNFQREATQMLQVWCYRPCWEVSQTFENKETVSHKWPMTRYCWGLRTVYMGDLPPSVTEEWVKELVGNIGVFSYLKVFFISWIIPFGQSHLCLKNESICIVLSQKLYITLSCSNRNWFPELHVWFKVGVNVKDGGKYAFLGMESREAGDAVIKALHLQVLWELLSHTKKLLWWTRP